MDNDESPSKQYLADLESDKGRVFAGGLCFLLMACLLVFGGCGKEVCHVSTKPDLALATVDMAGACLPCSQSPPYLNCAPSLCVLSVDGVNYCCVR